MDRHHKRIFESEAFDNKISGIRTALSKREQRRNKREDERSAKAVAEVDRLIHLSLIKLKKIYETFDRVVTQVNDADDLVGGNLNFMIDGNYGVMDFEGYIAHAFTDVLSNTGSEESIRIMANYASGSPELVLKVIRNGDADPNAEYSYIVTYPNEEALFSFVYNIYHENEEDYNEYEWFKHFNEALSQLIKRAEELEAETEEKLIKILDDYERKEIRGLKESRRPHRRMLGERSFLKDTWKHIITGTPFFMPLDDDDEDDYDDSDDAWGLRAARRERRAEYARRHANDVGPSDLNGEKRIKVMKI